MSVILRALFLLLTSSCSWAFIAAPPVTDAAQRGQRRVHHAPQPAGRCPTSSAMRTGFRQAARTRCSMAVEEMEQIVDFIWAKKLEVLDEAAGVAKYEFDIKAPERMTMSLNDRITRLIKDKANYPGFRPGTIPLQMMGEVNKFVVEEILNNCINMALDTYLLVGADGEGTEADIQPELNELVKVFKPGRELAFKTVVRAVPKSQGGQEGSEEQSGPEGAIDAELA